MRELRQHGFNRITQPIGLRIIHPFQEPLIFLGMMRAVFSVKFARLQTEIKSVLFLFGDFVPALGKFPHHAAAVFAFRDRAFKMEVFQWMVLHIDR